MRYNELAVINILGIEKQIVQLEEFNYNNIPEALRAGKLMRDSAQINILKLILSASDPLCPFLGDAFSSGHERGIYEATWAELDNPKTPVPLNRSEYLNRENPIEAHQPHVPKADDIIY